MVIFEIGMGELMLSMSDSFADPSKPIESKGREEIWEEDTDLWGNDCWTRVD